MELKELLSFVKEEHQRLMKFYGFEDNGQSKYPITVKIMEELGELAEEVLLADRFQRNEKLNGRDSKLDEELADVLITTLLLAENRGIDVGKALEQKIKKIREREY